VIVAVESNFVLELTFRQEEAIECERIMELASSGGVQLVIPACSLFEPFETLARRRIQRDQILNALNRELRELARTQAYAGLAETSKSVTRALAESGELHAAALESVMWKIAGLSTVIPLTGETMRKALGYQLVYPLSAQDNIVLASIDDYFSSENGAHKVFANKNRKDFSSPVVEGHLRQYRCRVIGSFADTRRYIEHAISA